MNIEDVIKSEKWRFSVTYAETAPHEYIVERLCANQENFRVLAEYIEKNGHYEYFYRHRYTYCSIGDFTYWRMGDVINRRWNDIYYTDERNQIRMVDDWKEKMKDGRVSNK